MANRLLWVTQKWAVDKIYNLILFKPLIKTLKHNISIRKYDSCKKIISWKCVENNKLR
jgi:hypothetical protein